MFENIETPILLEMFLEKVKRIGIKGTSICALSLNDLGKKTPEEETALTPHEAKEMDEMYTELKKRSGTAVCG